MSILRLYQYLETKRQSKHSTGRCSKHDSGERCHEEAHMHQDPSGMLARIPFGLTAGPMTVAEILVPGSRKQTFSQPQHPPFRLTFPQPPPPPSSTPLQ